MDTAQAKKTTTKKADLSATTLKEMLWTAILDIKTGKIDPSVAKAISGSAREIVNIEKSRLMAFELGLLNKHEVNLLKK